MAQHLRIRCVVKTDQTSAHERIHSVGGAKPDGSLYIERPAGHRIDVIVAVSIGGSKSLNKYLKTIADREQPDKLLSLPICPEI